MPTPTAHVVVGIDGSADSITALRWAEGYAATTAARLEVLCVWRWPIDYGYPVVNTAYSPETDAKAIAEQAVADLGLPTAQVSISIVEGEAGHELVRRSEHADLLVVGTHGHRVVSSLLLGSVSNYCVHHATIPVAVVRSK